MASTVIAQGSASISINAQETEARLTFIPDSGGIEWDAAAINKLAAEKNLRAFPDLKALEAFLHKASRDKTHEPLEMVFCHGIEPENPVNEHVSWETLPIPPDMASFQKEALDGAEPPRVCRIKVEKVKHEKKVKKPGALPFMPSKEEIEVTWERKEIREEVAVNPGVLEVKYALKGTKLGTITPSTPGKLGKSVFGRPIPPALSGDGSYLLGDGIAKGKNDLVAQVSGFLRIGENWADMVPLSKPEWRINTGNDGLTLFFQFEPGASRFAPPAGEEVLAAAVANGAKEELLVSAEKLEQAISQATETGECLEAFALFQTYQAEARVDISPDKTRAVLFLCKGTAGADPLEMKTISQAIKSSEVSGYDAEQLKTVIRTFMQGNDIILKDYVFAEGTPSTRGDDREIQVEAALLSGQEQKSVLARLKAWSGRHTLDNSEFDLQKATGIAFVEKGAIVATVSAVSDGEAGKDIYGNVIPGLPGNDPDIKLSCGLQMQSSCITASQSGLLILEASEKSFRGCVIDYHDARIDVYFCENAMEARADLFREEGAGTPLSVGYVLKTLADLGIRKGIDQKEVEKACALARTKKSAAGRILARGEPPIAQRCSAIKWLVPIDGPSKTVQIKAGIPIAELSEPFAAGRPGYTIKGMEIPVDRAIPQKIEHGSAIRELPAGKGKRLVAARSGELSFNGKELKIVSVKTIQGNAGPATGNINFSGEIQIGGNILPGCAVIGGSHVIVSGFAEGALISAGGKAIVALGFKGNGKGVIRARAGIETAFVERASIMAVGDITLKKGAVLSTIKTNGKLLVSAENGKLSGGVCQARYGIDAADIGSEKGIHTSLSFGQDYLIKDQIDVCEEETAKLKGNLSEMEEKIKTILQNKLLISDEIRNEKIRLINILEQLKLKVFTLREKFEEHYESEIRIRGTVFPGVVIDSHGRYYELHQKRSRVVFYFDCESGTIKEKPLD